MRHVGYRALALLLLVTVAGMAGCASRSATTAAAGPSPARAGSGPAKSSVAKDPAPSHATWRGGIPEAKKDIKQAIGVDPSQPPTFTWSDRLLTCPYRYPSGTMVLSVKEL